ncbi:hypothetical protein CFI03_026555 [Paenibacillus sp. ATY16]|nr:hypothetical protein [Paenibacillus sp. ATY16]
MKRKVKKIKSIIRDYGKRIDSSFNELEYLNVQFSKDAGFLPQKLKKKRI